MPTPPTYPGVYVEEIPTGIHTITGVSTAITAFVGRTPSGPTDTPARVTSFADFELRYGGLALDCPLTYSVRQYFDNGGREALIARIVHCEPGALADEAAPITDADIADPSLESSRRGLWLLAQADAFNLLCIPPLSRSTDVGRTTWDAAVRFATLRRAFVIVDPPSDWTTAEAVAAGVDQLVTRDANAALYFPRILAPDPQAGNAITTFAPCGAVAGVYARTDATRGVWKGPAGTDAVLSGVTGLTTLLGDQDLRRLNSLAINSLRNLPAAGRVVWGARTLAGADALGSEWKYVPVRRTALFIEESLYRGTRWAVFEPNDESIWAKLRLGIGAFLHDLFRQGAFQGSTPRDAYFVKCDHETTTPNDIDLGMVNILVGFAPLKPAEFVLIRIRQRAGPPSN